MRSFVHFAPGETQGCIGCHASRNQVTGQLSQGMALALRRAPMDLIPPPWGVTGFAYYERIQPIMNRHCLSCHGADKPAGNLSLTGEAFVTVAIPGKNKGLPASPLFSVSYNALMKKYSWSGILSRLCELDPETYTNLLGKQNINDVSGKPLIAWIPTDNGQEWTIPIVTPTIWGSPNSRLTDIILAGHPDKEGKPRIKLDDTEKAAFLTWMDLNCPFYKSFENEQNFVVALSPDKGK